MPKRVQLSRKKGWRKPENTVVVSRPGKWGNPFNWKSKALWLDEAECKRLAVVDFEDWLDDDEPVMYQAQHKWILDHIHELAGKNLACWCKQQESCHADVLLRLANKPLHGTAEADG